MNREIQDYYENRLSLFSTKGWKDLMDDVQDIAKATNDISSVMDEKTLHFRRGELSIMRWLLNLEAVSRDSYENLQKEERNAEETFGGV